VTKKQKRRYIKNNAYFYKDGGYWVLDDFDIIGSNLNAFCYAKTKKRMHSIVYWAL